MSRNWRGRRSPSTPHEASPGSKLGRAAPIAESASRPWDQGYELAEEVHERFDGAFERDDCVDVKALGARRSHREAGAVG